jgi:hypothetical protein
VPASFRLDHAKRLVETRGTGVLTGSDLLDHMAAMRALFDAGSLDATWGQIVDFTDITGVGEPLGDTVEHLARSNPWPRECRRVVIAPMTAIFGLSRMYQLLTGDPDQSIAVVRTRAEALELIALDPAP